MRRRSMLLAALLAPLCIATPFSSALVSDTELSDLQNSTASLEERGSAGCPVPCGYYGQLCCQYGQVCYTDSNNQAQCGAGGTAQTTPAPQAGSGSGYWSYWTSTWVETNVVTRTSVYSSWVAPTTSYYAAASQTAAPLQCGSGQSSCGNICCASGQYCVTWGQCGTSAQSSASLSAPLRPTASTLIVATASLPTTTTVPFIAPMATGQMANATVTTGHNGGGLSGGAIAGIVIGVLAAIIILFLLCLCLCFKAAWDSLLAIFGLGRRGKRRETVEYDSYRRSGDGRTWYGGVAGSRPGRVERRDEEKKKRFGTVATIGAGLAGLLVALGLRRRHNKKKYDDKSDYSSDYYSYYYSDLSSSDRRTRDTRRSASRSRR